MKVTQYYDTSKILSYSRLLSFVIGARGFGKTYGFKKFVINQFIKHGYQFIYLRRYKSEFSKVKFFFDAVKKEFPQHKFEVKGRTFYINDKIAGWGIPLSSWQSEKSTEYPDVATIIFDEFIREKDMGRYLPNEPRALLNFTDTVFRLRDGAQNRIICLSNAVTIVNPYFVFFGLIPDKNKEFYTKGECVVQIADSTDFVEERKQTRFGKLIAGTEYAEMALNNEFTGDNYTFVAKRTKDSNFLFAITYDGLTFGVWHDNNYMYMSQQYDMYTKNHFAIRNEDMTEDTKLCINANSHYYLKKFLSAFNKGLLRFDNLKIRGIGYDILKRL